MPSSNSNQILQVNVNRLNNTTWCVKKNHDSHFYFPFFDGGWFGWYGTGAATSSLKLHLTLFVMTLSTPEEIDRAQALLHSVTKDAKQIFHPKKVVKGKDSAIDTKDTRDTRNAGTKNPSVTASESIAFPVLHMAGLKVFNKGSVLYMDVVEDDEMRKVKLFVQQIYEQFVEHGLVQTKNNPFTPHATLMKMSQIRRKRKQKKKNKKNNKNMKIAAPNNKDPNSQDPNNKDEAEEESKLVEQQQQQQKQQPLQPLQQEELKTKQGTRFLPASPPSNKKLKLFVPKMYNSMDFGHEGK